MDTRKNYRKKILAWILLIALTFTALPARAEGTTGTAATTETSASTTTGTEASATTGTTEDPGTGSSAQGVVTPVSSLSLSTDIDQYVAAVNGESGVRNYHVYYQKGNGVKFNSFISVHGCAASALTAVLSGYKAKYASWTPTKVSQVLEKKVFGTKSWKKNYRKSLLKQMPVSLYGISKILTKCKISNRYVRSFKNADAVAEIKNHLYTGNAVIIEVNSRRQKNGKFYGAYTTKWALTKHTMALLGMTDDGRAIIADSAYRKWSGTKQRIKFAKVENLVKYMISCTSVKRTYYYDSIANSGGYILVNPQD